MPSFRTHAVVEILSDRPGLQRVRLDSPAAEGNLAYALTQLIGPVAVGDRVVVNTTAVELGLGTGGWHVVHWNLSREAWASTGPGHIMKLRYTSLQVDTGAADEEAGESSDTDDLRGLPVVACALHSQVACVAATFKALAPHRRLVYVMTDGAALPLALSDLVHDLRGAGLLDATVTAGQAFGGDVEAVNIHSGLALARRALGADAVVAGIGPGAVGTGSRLGHTGLEVATIVDAAAVLGGRGVVAVRYSDADARARHRGVSHHTSTALELCHSAPVVPSPDGVEVPDVGALLRSRGLKVTTMGRGPEHDPAFFQWAGAAGVVAARLSLDAHVAGADVADA
ncbi:MAG: FIG00517240: hypothetical protein [uncultured Acidimicrobiales bacterium]|uniref:DUF3866 family protein n=1 Tax=uncultured Acidimicrobiales bacterium TaxID=310071 RepID=A0A6J4H4A3_9ACTN|nr:MAG: FIG00517240: hypothetical protein [uncultured Acidimicrobiales bacterium]